MKKLTTAITLVVILITTIALTMAALPVGAQPPLHKVIAGGTVDWPDFGMESYGFTARQTSAAGNATGHFHVTLQYESFITGVKPWILDGDVLYLAVNATAGEAWIGAVMTSSNDPNFIGLEYVVRVKDGGKGPGADPDAIGYIDFTRAAIEALDMPTDLFLGTLVEWANGNVQIV